MGCRTSKIALDLGTSQGTVGKWRKRFLQYRVGGLADEERPGRPASVTLDQVEDVLTDTLELATDPDFVAKVVDVVGLYHHPPEKAVVLCVDEKTQVQAVNRSQP